MKVHHLDGLLCGYKIDAYDMPKQISQEDDANYIALPIERSPVHCLLSVGYPPKASLPAKLEPINEKDPQRRERAIRVALGRWIDENAAVLKRLRDKHVPVSCNGECGCEICLDVDV